MAVQSKRKKIGKNKPTAIKNGKKVASPRVEDGEAPQKVQQEQPIVQVVKVPDLPPQAQAQVTNAGIQEVKQEMPPPPIAKQPPEDNSEDEFLREA